jgi:hypothetical protein
MAAQVHPTEQKLTVDQQICVPAPIVCRRTPSRHDRTGERHSKAGRRDGSQRSANSYTWRFFHYAAERSKLLNKKVEEYMARDERYREEKGALDEHTAVQP